MSKDRKKYTAVKRGLKVEPIPELKEEKSEEVKLKKVAALPTFRQIWEEYTTGINMVEHEKIGEFCNWATLYWVGFRKDSNEGKIWGVFSEKEKMIDNTFSWWTPHIVTPDSFFVFSGRIGGPVAIKEISREMIYDEICVKKANYVTMVPNKLVRLIDSWPEFQSEIGMFLTCRKLRHA